MNCNLFLLLLGCFLSVVHCHYYGSEVPYCDLDICDCEAKTDLGSCPSKEEYKNITSPDSGVCIYKDKYFWQGDDGVCANMNDCCGKNRVAANWFKNCPEECPFLKSSPYHILVKCTTIQDPNNLHCNCAPGHALNIHGECIPQEDCPKCKENQLYVKCPNPCPDTCLNRGKKPLCAAMCLREGCTCKTGFVKDMDGNCILEKDCPVCGENEEYVSKPMPCAGTCRNPSGNPYCRMAQQKEGCACKKGFIRNEQGTCIDQNDCPVY